MGLQEIVMLAGGAVALLATIIEVTPIKINPWKWLAKQVGHAINGEVIAKVDKLDKNFESLQTDVKSLRTDFEVESATTCRTRIMRFGDEIRHGTRHSKEHFDQILLDISEYEQYCSGHPKFKNNVAVATIDKIKRTYQDCLDKDSFL